MSSDYFAKDISIKGHSLTVVAVNLNSKTANFDTVVKVAREVFSEMVPHLKSRRRALYIRDVKDYAITEKLPGGDAYVPEEINVGVSKWPVAEKALISTLAHEMHHWVRVDKGLYGGRCSLGESVVSEGLASHYETVRSGFQPPYCKDQIAQKVWKPLLEAWDGTDYDYHTWRFNGQFGKWPMYTAGYILSREYFKDGFDLKESLLDLNAQFKALAKRKAA